MTQQRPWAGLSARTRATTILASGIVAAALAGGGHALSLLIERLALGHLVWVPRDFAWMAPLSYALVLVPAAAACALVALAVRHGAWLWLSIFGLATTTAFGILLPYPQLGRPAALVLAMGLGVQAARWVHARAVSWARVAGPIALGAMGLVAATALAQPRLRAWRESRAVAALPAAAPHAPNVLLVVLDAARAKSMGFVTPGAGTTPHLDRWAASGAVFQNAYSAGPWTLPSHASMLSGLPTGQLSADWTVPVSRHHPVLPEILRARGYLTAGFVANLHYTAWDSGLERGFVHYDDYQLDWPQVMRSSSFMQTALADTLLRVPKLATVRNLFTPDLSIIRQHRYRSRLGAEVIDAFLSWEARRPERPWFALVNLMDPHLVTTAADDDRRRYPHDERGEADYLAAMRYLDVQVDRLLSTLADRGALERTVVVVTADHGELLGEHGLEGHARSVYRDVLHVPLFIRYPPRVPGVRVTRAVSLRDLAATLQDLAGVTDATTALPGVSLANAWVGTTRPLSPVIAEVRQQPSPLGDYPTATGDLAALFDERSYYIRNLTTGREELFDIATDPTEAIDLAQAPGAVARLAPWRLRLQEILASRR